MAVYCCSDLHGRYDLFQMIKDFIQPEDKVYVLGDCGDRGPDGWKIIKEVYFNPQFIYLQGNHEDMLADAIRGNAYLCYCNGGSKTLEDFYAEDVSDSYDWVQRLRNLPVREEYINTKGQKIVLTHAGFTPYPDVKYIRPSDLIWDRTHFDDKWYEGYDNIFMIHGHTPIPYMDEYLWDAPSEKEVGPGVYWYSPDDKGVNHKCNIDCGAFFTGHTALLNLDTFEQHIFMAEDCVYED